MIFAWLSMALAADQLIPIHAGDTVESLAADRGDPTLADAIRALNNLQPGEPLRVGQLIRIPDPSIRGEQDAFLISLSGKATMKGATPLSTFQPIPLGVEFCTLEKSKATVRLASTCNADGSASDDITMSPNTCLVVAAANSSASGRSTVVRVTSGSIAVLTQVDPKGQVTIVTPSGITTGAVGGFRVTLEDAASRTETLDGQATVAGSGVEVALQEGQGSRTKTGEAPSPAVDLLRMSTLLSPPDPSILLRPSFTWADVEGALGYRFEIGGSPDFREVLYQEDTPEPAHDPLVMMLPYDQLDRVFWRVSAFDRFGFLGIPSDPYTLTFPSTLR